ncbi:hypothetical protein MMC13_000747 [Lambiella insularis]|nr:hypothetical protein [Lambiella insularis]
MEPQQDYEVSDRAIRQPQFPFLRLPLDLRLIIYELVLCSPFRLVLFSPEVAKEREKAIILLRYKCGSAVKEMQWHDWRGPRVVDRCLQVLDLNGLLNSQMTNLPRSADMLATCKQIHNEAAGLYVQKNTFFFHEPAFHKLHVQQDSVNSPAPWSRLPHYTELTSLFLTIDTPKQGIPSLETTLSLLEKCSSLRTLRLAIAWGDRVQSERRDLLRAPWFEDESLSAGEAPDMLKEVVGKLPALRHFQCWRYIRWMRNVHRVLSCWDAKHDRPQWGQLTDRDLERYIKATLRSRSEPGHKDGQWFRPSSPEQRFE